MSVLTTVLRYLSFYVFVVMCFGVVLCLRMKKRKLFALRSLAVPFASLLCNYTFWRDVLKTDLVAELVNTYIFPHIAIFMIAVLVIWFCFDLPFISAFFFQSVASVLEHLLFNVKNMIRTLCFPQGTGLSYLLIVLFLSVAMCVIIFFTLSKPFSQFAAHDDLKVVMGVLGVIDVTYTIVLSQVVYVNLWTSVAVNIFRIIICVCFVMLPVILFRSLESRAEKRMYEQMLIQSEKQMLLAKENVEAINLKCHDLKYRISALKDVSDECERRELIADLEKNVMIHDAVAKTGNPTLDVLLTEKCLLCDNYGIDFTYIADGSLLGFMKKADLYALFGNALDNAIEAVKDLEDGQRIISLSVVGRDKLVSVCLENYCARQLEFTDGVPVTTKTDKASHGYGIKNMMAVTEKYGGNFFISREEESFKLNMLFFR